MSTSSRSIASEMKFGTPAQGIVAVVAMIALAALVFAPMRVRGSQTTLGTVTGIVTDPDGARLPGVSIKLKNEDTGLTSTAFTNKEGIFQFQIQPGQNYTLTADLAGFKQVVMKKIPVRMADTTPISIRMMIGDVSNKVVVEISRDQLMKESTAHVGIVLDESQIQGFPPYGNDPLALLATLPGYRANPMGHEFDTVGGLPLSSVNTVRDGLSVTDGFFPGMISEQRLILNPVDAAPGSDPRIAGLFDNPNRIPPAPQAGAEAYDRIVDNPFVSVKQSPIATFSSDVDTASYSNIRRFLMRSQMPPRDAVRIEEMINYFSYDYPKVSGSDPIAANMEVAAAPWNPRHRLVRIGLRAKDVKMGQKPTNLVFLIDVSGSMAPNERLPLIKDALRMLVERLTESDRVTIVTYAGETGVALRPTTGDHKDTILRAIDALSASGSTNGGAGIQLAYENAVRNYVEGGVNRVILATDGDFNVGITDRNELLRLIQDKARSGVFLTTVGVGSGNFKDATLEALADKGNGNYAYLDSLKEARKVLVDGLTGTLVTVAKDVKLQLEFNPAKVSAYRLIGYENRMMRREDFNDDRKDAGDMGAGHTVTALFEIVPLDADESAPVEGLRYQPAAKPAPARSNNPISGELLNLRIRYKDPDGSESKLIEFPLVDRNIDFKHASSDFRFASAVATFGMILRGSPYRGSASMENALRTAIDNKGSDKQGYREEFVQLLQKAIQLGVR